MISSKYAAWASEPFSGNDEMIAAMQDVRYHSPYDSSFREAVEAKLALGLAVEPPTPTVANTGFHSVLAVGGEIVDQKDIRIQRAQDADDLANQDGPGTRVQNLSGAQRVSLSQVPTPAALEADRQALSSLLISSKRTSPEADAEARATQLNAERDAQINAAVAAAFQMHGKQVLEAMQQQRDETQG